MAGETENPDVETPDKDKTPEEPVKVDKPADKPSDTPAAPAGDKTYTKAELEAAIAEGVKAAKAKDEAEANKKKLKDQGEYQKLYEAEQAKTAELERELAAERLTRIREKMGKKYELSELQTARLIGTNETEIEADAKKVRADLGPVAGGGDGMGTPPGGKGNSGKTDKAAEREKMLRSGNFSL